MAAQPNTPTCLASDKTIRQTQHTLACVNGALKSQPEYQSCCGAVVGMGRACQDAVEEVSSVPLLSGLISPSALPTFMLVGGLWHQWSFKGCWFILEGDGTSPSPLLHSSRGNSTAGSCRGCAVDGMWL